MSGETVLRETGQDGAVTVPGVVFVGPYPPPYGGISSHLRDITDRFSARGIRCCVLSWTTEDDSEVERGRDLHVHRARNAICASRVARSVGYLLKNPTLIPLLGTLGFRRFLSAVNRALIINDHTVRCDVRTVSIYGTREGDVIPFLRAFNPNLRVAFTFFADPIKRESFYRREARFWRRAFAEAHHLASSSQYCAAAAQRLFPDLEPQVIYVGVEIEKFSTKPSGQGGDGGIVSVLFFGRMERDMGVDDALSIADAVTRENADVEFVIAGAKGELTPLVLERAAASGGRIRAMVNVAHEAVPSMFAGADVLIAPTVGRHACMGVSVKEAMASGLPAVVSDSGGLPEAVSDGVEGLVVPLVNEKNDIPRFVTVVQRLCNDRPLRQSMGERGRKKAEEVFSNHVTEQRVLQLLQLD